MVLHILLKVYVKIKCLNHTVVLFAVGCLNPIYMLTCQMYALYWMVTSLSFHRLQHDYH